MTADLENMTDDELVTSEAPSEKETLLARAKMLGLTGLSPNIGVATLRKKIAEALEPAVDTSSSTESEEAERMRQIRDLTKLVRIRLTCMNPEKAQWEGDIYTFINKHVGQVSKYIPFNPAFYENGYHVPQCIVDILKDKKAVIFRTKKVGELETSEAIQINEFNIEILEPLTKEEMKELARKQAAAAGKTL